MGAVDLLDRLLGAGLTVTARGENMVISPWSGLPTEMLADLRTHKPALLALLAGAKSRPPATTTKSSSASTCTDCLHRLVRGTCGEPVAAGLLTAEEGFGIVWPPAGHARACPSYTDKAPSKARDRPYRLTQADADTCHAGGWDDAEISRFQARTVALRRRGIADHDADDLAERLTLHDRQQDDRSLCLECSHYRPGRCGNHRRAGMSAPDVGRDLAAMLQCCPGFTSMESHE